MDRIVAPYQPKMVVLYAGDNDLANDKTPQRVFEDYREFVTRTRQKLPGIRIAFISIKPSPARWTAAPSDGVALKLAIEPIEWSRRQS